MDTFGGFELREMPVNLAFVENRRRALLQRCGLSADNADFAVGIYDSADNLVATASLDGDIIKGVAVDEHVRSESFTSPMVTAIVNHAAGRPLKVVTKPEYEAVFNSLAFVTLGRCDTAVMLSADHLALERHKQYLRSLERNGRVGCVVVNANPTTLGHLSLITRAADQVDTLFVIPLGENSTGGFDRGERLAMLRAATAHLTNVTVTEPSDFVINRATFPTYFLKKITDATAAHIGVDLDIFLRHLSPALGVTVRFVGTEPTDPLTAEYNRLMKEILPANGVEVVELDRLPSKDGKPVSASRVRKAIDEGRVADAFTLVPPSTIPFLIGHAASWALQSELDLTPKPGLVDKANNGAHTDMNHALMSRSIGALEPVFVKLAHFGLGHGCGDVAALKALGIEGERIMMAATGGVNTHRGALFSLGLSTVSVASLMGEGSSVTPEVILGRVADMASRFERPEGTHGAEVARRYACPTALDSARRGYPEVLASMSETDSLRCLLRLMSVLDDSNIYHRCGAATAAEVKLAACEALQVVDHDHLIEKVNAMDQAFIAQNISPGGCADMLALALFLRSVSSNSNN